MYHISQIEDNQNVLHLKGTEVDTVDDVFDREWDAWDVDKWIGWVAPKESVSMPHFLRQPTLLQRYPTADDIELALSQMLNFGHDGLEGITSEKGRRDFRNVDPDAFDGVTNRMLANGHICRCYPSRLFISAKVYLARGPRGVQKGDKIVVFQGAKVPFVIIPVVDLESCFTLVGECCKYRLRYAAFGSQDQCRAKPTVMFVQTCTRLCMDGRTMIQPTRRMSLHCFDGYCDTASIFSCGTNL